MRVQWVRVGLTLAAVAVMVGQIGGCGQTVAGSPSALSAIDPADAGGLPVNDTGATGPKEGVPDATLQVEGATGSVEDRLAINAVADLYEYWGEVMPKYFDEEFKPIQRLVSYDSNGAGVTICGSSTAGFVNAFYCGGGGEDAIAWDRGVLLPALTDMFGPMSVVGVLAHEMGHAVQFRLGEKSNMSQSTPTIVREQQADCYMGNFMRWVVDKKSKHFDLNTGKGLNDVLATVFFIRDPAGLDSKTEGAHGLAFDRVFAFQEGYRNDPKRCAQMDVEEIDGRIEEKERTEADEADGGEAQLTTANLDLLQDSLDEAFKDNGAEQPEITDNGSKCEEGESTSPATYCVDENIVGIDLDKLTEIAQPPKEGAPPGEGDGLGDFAAFAEIASRYTLAIQKQIGADLDDKQAGLRTACLTGAWTRFTIDDDPNQSDGKLHLAVGDLDEAVAELLQDDSLIAADVNGKQVPSGFARVEAFRRGYVDGSDPCTKDFV